MAKFVNLRQRIKEWVFPTFYLVDLEDNFVLYEGRFTDCEDVMDMSYGGTFAIYQEHELPDGCTPLENSNEL